MSSFNKRFASFYYNIPKKILPLENTAKIHYATTFPRELSLLILEIKSVTLQHIFIDCLEFEENIKISKKMSNQDSGGEMKDKLELVGPHKPRETVPVHPKPWLTKQRDDQPYDVKEDGSANLFFEDCSQPSTNFVNGGFKRDFSMPIYDEYED